LLPTPAEQRLISQQIRETTWDDGVLRAFMSVDGDARIRAWNIRLPQRQHRLLLIVPSSATAVATQKAIAEELGRLLGMLHPPRAFTTILWWRDDPRRLAADAWPTRREINGGWTVAGSSVICVYRSEEWTRVVLHEMIHALEWDWHMPYTDPLPCWGLPAGSRMMPAFFEAWTELLAEWLWCGFYRVDWGHQRAWQDMQACQILARHPVGKPWVENTSVFAYYVLKAALAPYMPTLWFSVAQPTEAVLCEWTAEPLRKLRDTAHHDTRPAAISLRMTVPATTTAT
jgi:hypothetical protein